MRHKPQPACPFCTKPLGSTVHFGLVAEPDPSPGDVVVCTGCGMAVTFTDDLTLRMLSPDDWSRLTVTEMSALRSAIRAWLLSGGVTYQPDSL